MPERVLYPEFRAEQEFTRYPFADSASLASDTGRAIDADTFLDAGLYPVGAADRVYIANINVDTRAVTVTLGDARSTDVARATFDPLDPPSLVAFEDAAGRPAGVLVSEALRLGRFAAWGSGDHRFARGATEFAASCVTPTPGGGVRGFVTEQGDVLTGDVWFVGENGVVFRLDGDCTVRLDVVGDPLFVRNLCEPVDLFEPPVFVKTINGRPPDEAGNFNLTVGDQAAPGGQTIVRINPTDDGLIVEAVGQRVRGA